MKCFVIMPFAPEFDDVYQSIKVAVETSAPEDTITCRRLDEIKSAGRITNDLIQELNESIACIADLTGCKPNVMWEVGYAMALQKPMLLLSQDIATLPFDIKDMRTVAYQRDALVRTLQKPLGEAFRHTLGKLEARAEARRAVLPVKRHYSIAVTGSTQGDVGRLKSRIAALLHPYLSEDTTWLVGSYGRADEAAIEYLATNRQNVVVVGYHSFDISPRAFKLMEKYKIPFLDAQKEQLPKGMQAPSERDLFFLTKSDLLVVFWDGASRGTHELVDWYSQNGRDHIVGFI